MVKCFGATRETDNLGFIVGNGIVRTSPSKVALVKDLPLPETHKQINGSIDGLVPKVFARACSSFGCYQGCF